MPSLQERGGPYYVIVHNGSQTYNKLMNSDRENTLFQTDLESRNNQIKVNCDLSLSVTELNRIFTF